MDYKEKLKDALKDENTDYEVVRWIESNFPELAENKDEKIRKELIDLIYKVYANTNYITCAEHEEMLAWLEMQGEKKSDICDGCNNIKGCVTCVDGDQWAHITEASTVELSDDENPTHSEVTKTWSEEDEKAFEGVIGFLHLYGQFESSKFVDTLKKRIKGE